MKFSDSVWTRFKNRFGIFQLVVVIGGSIAILFVTILLGSLWVYCNHQAISAQQNERDLWSKLILKGWLSQFVTMCSSVLRICISVQLLLACMMLSSLALEKQHVREKDIGITFIRQYSASGPFGICWTLITGTNSARKTLGLAAIVFLTIESVVIQFSSTFLLGDLKPVLLREKAESTVSLNYTFGAWTPGDDLNLFSATPIEFPIFAEKAEDRLVISADNSPGLVDSGRVIRALLPMRGSTSSTLAAYEGPVTGVNTQAVCFSPTFSSASAQFGKLPARDVVFFSAQLDNMRPGSPNRVLFDQSSLKFAETPELDFDPIKNCSLTAGVFSICDITDNINRKFKTPEEVNSFPAEKVADVGFHWLLVSNTTWSDLPSDFANSPMDRDGYEIFDGTEWSTSKYPAQNLVVRQSLCAVFFKWAAGDVEVEVKTSNYTEPRLYRMPPSPNGGWEFDTTAVQRQLGVDQPKRMSQEDRSVLNLPVFNLNKSQGIYSIGFSLLLKSTRGAYGATIPGFSESHVLEPTVATIFKNTNRDTQQLSLAFEASMNTAYTCFYYHLLDFLIVPGQADMRFFKLYSVPQRFRGMWLVVGIIGLHFLLVGLITWFFFSSDSFKNGIPDPEFLGHLVFPRDSDVVPLNNVDGGLRKRQSGGSDFYEVSINQDGELKYHTNL
ncbi:hypothetical protein BZA77DRAFT_77813 [Pyronema omphalodes]|nr:hypothetical protein BZA77DRAFT_77813 [Pyronema omphalodes]